MEPPDWSARVAYCSDPDAVTSGLLVSERLVLTWGRPARSDEAEVTLHGDRVPRPATVVEAGRGVVLLELTKPVTVLPADLGPYSALDIYQADELAVIGAFGPADDIPRTVPCRANPTAWASEHSVRISPGAPLGLEGFRGAAVLHPQNLFVIGVVDEPAAATMVPIAKLIRLSESVRTLIRLGPLDPEQYRRLHDILTGCHVQPADLRNVLARSHQVWGFLPAGLSSLVMVAEALVTEAPWEFEDEALASLSQFLVKLHRLLDPASQEALKAWHNSCLWSEQAAGEPEPRIDTGGVVTIRISPVASGDTELYELTVWAAGSRSGELGEPVRVVPDLSADRVRAEVEAILPEAVRRLPSSADLVMYEFILARDWLSHPVESWESRIDNDDVTLGMSGPVVVRDLDWFSDSDPGALQRRAGLLTAGGRDVGDSLVGFNCATPPHRDVAYKALLRKGEGILAMSLADPWTGPGRIWSAVRAGVPLVLWRRIPCAVADHDPATCDGAQFQGALAAMLAGASFDDVPDRVRNLRQEALIQDDAAHCGCEITVLHDSGNRRPMQLTVEGE